MVLLVTVLILFRGLRWRTGTDWIQFEEVFNTCTWNVASYYRDDGNRMDMGWVLLNRIVKVFGDYTLFLLITNSFLVGTWAYLSKKLVPDRYLLAFGLVIVSNMFFPVRLQIAAGIFCWVIYLLYKKNYIGSFFIYLIVCSFHKSAIMLFPLVLLLNVRISDICAIIIIFTSLVGEMISNIFSDYMLLLSAYIGVFYPELASNIVTYSNSTIIGLQEKTPIHIFLSFALSLILLIGLIKARTKIEKHNLSEQEKRKFNIFFNCFVFFTFISKFFNAEALSNLVRMIEFFTFGYSISIALAYKYLNSKRTHSIFVLFFVLYYIVKIRALLNTPFPDEFFPYYSVFDSSLRRL